MSEIGAPYGRAGDYSERNRGSRGNSTRGSSDWERRRGSADGGEWNRDLETSIGRELSRFRDGSNGDRRHGDEKDSFGRDRHYREQGYGYRDSDRDRSRDRTYRDRDRSRSRDRDRCKDRDRDRDRDRDHFGRDRDWDDDERDRRSYRDDYDDEDYGPRRDRDYDRDQDYGRDYGRDRDYYRSSRDRDDPENRSWHRQERRGMEEPTNIIMLRGLPESITKDDIVEELQARNTVFKDLRVVRSNKGGFSRGFCFLEFPSLSDARDWMDQMKGFFAVKDTRLGLDYSRPRNKDLAAPPSADMKEKDWTCLCGIQNFHSKKRSTCFGCGAPKPDDDDEENDKEKDVGKNPCKVLIIKGLDVLTTEERIKQSLVEITALPIYDVRLIKDKLTGTSRGFCFVELESVQAASQLLEVIANMIPALTIDGKVATASYAIQNSSNPSSKAGGNTGGNKSRNHATGSAAANAIAQAQAAASMGTAPAYQQYQQAAVATQIQAPSAGGQTPSQVQGNQANQDGSAAALQPGQSAPPGANYVYDPNSGYHYDANTGLYYDSNTQYHYNSVTGQYLLWNAATQQYVPVAADWSGAATTPSSSAGATSTAAGGAATGVASTADSCSATPGDSATAKEKQKKAKSLQAKKIAKDMERWAKGLNAAKSKPAAAPAMPKEEENEGGKESDFKKPLPLTMPTKPANRMNVVQGFASMPAMPERVESSPLAAMSSLKPAAGAGPLGSIVAEYGEEDSDPEEDPTDKFTDLKLMACLLCKRQFPNKEGLERHQQLSDLHKQNLEIHKKMSMSEEELEEYERHERQLKYRDRAKERRTKYRQPEPAVSNFAVSKKRRREPAMPVYEQPTVDGIGGDNIGNQMLKAMGWTEGSGLGKSGQGIVNPIEARIRAQGAGLGVKGSNYGATSTDTYKKKVKKMAMSRFQDNE